MSYLKKHDDHITSNGGYGFDVFYLENFEGRLRVEVCDACGYVVVTCEHIRNTWTREGDTLTCNLCGADGT